MLCYEKISLHDLHSLCYFAVVCSKCEMCSCFSCPQMNAVLHSNIQEGIRHYYDDLDFKNILDFVQEKVWLWRKGGIRGEGARGVLQACSAVNGKHNEWFALCLAEGGAHCWLRFDLPSTRTHRSLSPGLSSPSLHMYPSQLQNLPLPMLTFVRLPSSCPFVFGKHLLLVCAMKTSFSSMLWHGHWDICIPHS